MESTREYPFLPAKAWHVIYEIPQSISAGIVEELVVVALLVTVLEQARTKVWVIYVAEHAATEWAIRPYWRLCC